jgi:hypothetical protein
MLTHALIVAVAVAQLPERQTFGAVVAPAVLPSGTSAAYGYVGAPEVGAGYRQGFGLFELEGRAAFNYLQLTFSAEVLARYDVWHNIDFSLAPVVGVAFVADTGSQYFDKNNFSYLGIRPRLGVVWTGRISETISGLAEGDIPFALSIAPTGGSEFTPLGGGGLEIYLGEHMTAMVLGQIGVDVIKEPGGVTQTRFGYGLRLGLGYRMF